MPGPPLAIPFRASNSWSWARCSQVCSGVMITSGHSGPGLPGATWSWPWC